MHNADINQIGLDLRRRRLNPFSLFAISRLFARLTPLREETRYVSADVLDISFLRLRAPSEGTDSVYLRDTHEHALAMGIQAMSYALAESWMAGWRSLSLSLSLSLCDSLDGRAIKRDVRDRPFALEL